MTKVKREYMKVASYYSWIPGLIHNAYVTPFCVTVIRLPLITLCSGLLQFIPAILLKRYFTLLSTLLTVYRIIN